MSFSTLISCRVSLSLSWNICLYFLLSLSGVGVSVDCRVSWNILSTLISCWVSWNIFVTLFMKYSWNIFSTLISCRNIFVTLITCRLSVSWNICHFFRLWSVVGCRDPEEHNGEVAAASLLPAPWSDLSPRCHHLHHLHLHLTLHHHHHLKNYHHQ